ARPRMRQKRLHGASVEAGQRLLVAQGVGPQEVHGEERNVLPAIAQGGQADLDRIDPEQQVLPEAALGDLLTQVAVGGAERADIDAPRLGRSHPLALARVEYAQELS